MNLKFSFSSLFNHKCFTFLVTFSLLLSLSIAPVFAAPAPAGRAAIASLAAGSWQCDSSMGPTCLKSLSSVAMVSASEGWAVGDSGTILHYTGGSWQSVENPTSSTLTSVSMVSANEGWAVGPFDTILHYKEGSWQTVVDGEDSNVDLTSVSMVSASEGWAVGYGGIILHYTGGAWQSVASPVGNDLNSVVMVSATKGWTVGSNEILHYTWHLPPVAFIPFVRK
jgi:hypothetical protein